LRIRVIQTPPTPSIDGIRVDQFQQGFVYDISSVLASLFLAEGWAEPVAVEGPALVIPLDELGLDAPRSSLPPGRESTSEPTFAEIRGGHVATIGNLAGIQPSHNTSKPR
jgi:hypothetical protein